MNIKKAALLVKSAGEITSEGLTPGRYRHFKGGTYTVLFTARDSETEDLMVVYLNSKGEPWIRPLSMWNELTDRWPDGVERSRFVPMEEAPADWPA